MQNAGDAHETATSAWVLSISCGAPHPAGLSVIASPPVKVAFWAWSTATQNDVDGHATLVSVLFGSIVRAALQAPRRIIDTVPARPTAAQKDTDGHETEVANTARSTFVGADQLPAAAASTPATADAGDISATTNAQPPSTTWTTDCAQPSRKSPSTGHH